jgi:tryptophan-rich sensory protein
VKGYNASVKSALIAGAFCVFGVLVEGLCAGKSTGAVMKSLRQPRWALPMTAWYVLGFAYYAVCFTTVYRLGVVGGRVALLIVIGLLMLANAMWNALFFRMRDLKLSLLFYIPYSAGDGIGRRAVVSGPAVGVAVHSVCVLFAVRVGVELRSDEGQ